MAFEAFVTEPRGYGIRISRTPTGDLSALQLEHQRLLSTLNIGIRKLRRIIQPLFEPQTRRLTGYAVDEKVGAEGRGVHALQQGTLRVEQFRWAS
ncbi:UNVERIFIED_ORG: hypothetical protein J2Y76_001512 [Pseudomonas reinekei]|nr:hypothetical protein [Pseudomonas reinekei]